MIIKSEYIDVDVCANISKDRAQAWTEEHNYWPKLLIVDQYVEHHVRIVQWSIDVQQEDVESFKAAFPELFEVRV